MAFTVVIIADKAAESNTPSTFKRWSKNNVNYPHTKKMCGLPAQRLA